MTIYLVRHGKDDGTVRGGWSSHGLSPEGVTQVQALAEDIAAAGIHVGCIYSSDLRRAAETAQILSSRLGCPVEYIPGLREANNGVLAGMKNDAANEKYPGLYWSALAYQERYPGGESPAMFYERVKAAWLALKRGSFAQQMGKDALLVTHGGVMEAILCTEHDIVFSNKAKHFSAPSAKLIPIEIETIPD